VAGSLAFFLGAWGIDGLDLLWTMLRQKAGMESGGDGEDGER
jgi:hypothetical protein